MTSFDKINLLKFIAKTGMYVSPVDEQNIVSFIHGYELGTKPRCNFSELSKQLLTDKYKVMYSSDGWAGQIGRLSEKLSLSWIATFKKTALEIVADEQSGGLDRAMTEILKSRVVSLIERINALGDTWFNESWIEEWLSLCSIKSKWFKQLWSNNEWTIVKAIDEQVQANNVFSKKSGYIPTEELLKLKEQYDAETKKNGT